jgi:hypothetical protein
MKKANPFAGRRKFTSADEDLVRRRAEQITREVLGGQPAITGIDRELSSYSSSYASDIISVHLQTGDEFKIFLKDFGFSQLPKDGSGMRRDRELCVYRDLLAGADLGTPRYYGSVWDEGSGRFWLLLELVSGLEVRSCAIDYWVAAAGWLGRLEAYFRGHADHLKECSFLIRHDADFFRSKAELALRQVSQIAPSQASRLGKLVEQYEPVVEVMASQPCTLVHGAYRPSNILISRGAGPVRVCPVDWELAACGSALYDLAFFTDGFVPPERDRLFDAYRQEAAATGLPLPEKTEKIYLVDCFRLHRVMNWLSRCAEKQFSAKEVDKLVSLGEGLRGLTG